MGGIDAFTHYMLPACRNASTLPTIGTSPYEAQGRCILPKKSRGMAAAVWEN
jgi:hypothetical protein